MKELEKESPFAPLDLEKILIETERCVAFFDRYPVSDGHVLVIPKRVAASLYDLPVDLQAELWETVRRTRERLIERFHPDGFNIGVNDGPAAGQTVPHVHIHVIPRYAGDASDPRGGIRWVLPEKAKYWE